MSTTSNSPNADEIAFWNGRSGEKWVQYQEMQDRMLRPHGVRAIDAARLAPGERVLDIGCGCGDTTLHVAQVVGAKGGVVGMDVSEVMLAHARRRAADASLPEIDFQTADAEIHGFVHNSTDVIVSRFGVMFFNDPVAAFANMRTALVADGRLAFVCWRKLSENPWVNIPFEVAARHVDVPAPADANAPGPFAFSDPERVERILRDSGFDDVRIEPFSPDQFVGGTLDEAVKYLMQMTPIAAAVAEAEPEMRAVVSNDLRPMLAPHAGPDGVYLGSASWIVTARAAR